MGNIPKVSSQQSNPNIPSQQVNPNTQQGSNKKTRRRIITILVLILPIIFVLQYSLNNQQEMITEKQITLNTEQQKLSSLKKDGHSLKNDVKTLTDSEEEILKFARKLYGFSKPNETIFQITE
ncbi:MULTISPECIES: FtsB family cell division protein [Bacillus cereus group]|uniref:Cell division protein DivIVC n=1 Tax=Bacillus wiedmannii TaxID=1890302 RepID=A0A2B5XTG5_9BACI|nr:MULTISPECIES: septum formation initiator family protein [Bacillus cereus group]OUB91049.1 cell division protein DivIVC [Bacillus thuringiensis serovar sinensis]MCU5114191.1 septum formation initiator family protein [Bacillus wiedmannii]MCU5153326.1 septum formation initiator family protein [Bacillus wiedmannii]MCU5412797.1 septum formation initiator family protein [Bacillus wiedmannii]PEM44070.1 cell division protein DivIVC [Bacillus wiedmannii]